MIVRSGRVRIVVKAQEMFDGVLQVNKVLRSFNPGLLILLRDFDVDSDSEHVFLILLNLVEVVQIRHKDWLVLVLQE